MLCPVLVKLHPHRLFLHDTTELNTKGEIHFRGAPRLKSNNISIDNF